MNENLKQAVRLLHIYTAGHCNVWQLAGNAKASCRAHIMSVLLGAKTPQSKSGVNAMREAFYSAAGITGDCEAHREENFRAWVKSAAVC